MIGNALKSVYKYMGLCIIGTLACTVYTPSAYADICFLPGSDCVTDITPGSFSTYEKGDDLIGSNSGADRCMISVEPENEICENVQTATSKIVNVPAVLNVQKHGLVFRPVKAVLYVNLTANANVRKVPQCVMTHVCRTLRPVI